MLFYQQTLATEIVDQVLDDAGIRVTIKREDQNHPKVSGNKWWKLNYNLIEARALNHDTLLTFGGAYSNHIYATAAAATEAGFKSIGIIRSDEIVNNPTLEFARSCGMQLEFISRSAYREKNQKDFLESIGQRFGRSYIIPEGGTNALAVGGCKAFAEQELSRYDFDYLILPVATGGTMAGIISGLPSHTKVIGITVLKGGHFLQDDIVKLLEQENDHKHHSPWELHYDFHHGGYAKTSGDLIGFVTWFQKVHLIPLEPIYSGKAMFALFELARRRYFPRGASILFLHTGGLQNPTQYA